MIDITSSNPSPNGSSLVFCTSNTNKFHEAKTLLAPFDIPLIHKKISLPEIQDNDIGSIALFSAQKALEIHPHALIVEDTGFYIHTLNGFPGPYAAFIENTIGNEGVLRLLAGITERSAEFRTAIAFIQPGHPGHVVESKVIGTISDSIRYGSKGEGWGYDPIFIPSGYQLTYAEMGREQKNTCSHRALAFNMFAEWYSAFSTSQNP